MFATHNSKAKCPLRCVKCPLGCSQKNVSILPDSARTTSLSIFICMTDCLRKVNHESETIIEDKLVADDEDEEYDEPIP